MVKEIVDFKNKKKGWIFSLFFVFCLGDVKSGLQIKLKQLIIQNECYYPTQFYSVFAIIEELNEK